MGNTFSLMCGPSCFFLRDGDGGLSATPGSCMSLALSCLSSSAGSPPIHPTFVEEVVDAMEYCAYVHDTELVVLDNLQFMTAIGSREGGRGRGKGGFDRFYQMDVAVEKFRRFATEKNIHVILVVHPRKERDQFHLGIASFSGTAKATQDADNVVILL